MNWTPGKHITLIILSKCFGIFIHTVKQIKSLISIYERAIKMRACLTTHQSILIEINTLDHRWGTTSFLVAEKKF